MNESPRAERVDDITANRICGPIRFEVYGAASPPGWGRWVESVSGDGPAMVWLGHATADGDHGLLVGTAPRALFDHLEHPMQLDPVRSAALAAGDRLMNVIGSVDRSDLPPMKDLGEAVRNRIKKRVIDLSSWDRTSWIVSGAPVTAAVWHFAGAWIGIAEEVAGSHLVCMGVNFASDKPELATVAGTDYGVDFAAGLTIRDLQQSKAGLAMPEPNRRELRIDLQALQQ